MLLSLNWLSNFVDISDLTNDEIKEKLVKAGFEVESEEHLGLGTNLIVGKVIECHDHPDSDHLHVTKVDIGKEVLDIVCGAPNCREGLKVIVAQVGAKLPGGEIKAGVIRGQSSNGMLCSLKELNITEEMLAEDSPSRNGIEELDDTFEIGETDILSKLGLEDTIYDISIYANRPDCLGVFNMCREVAAILDKPIRLPEYEGAAEIGKESSLKIVSESANCTHFLGKVVNNVTIKESPKWMKDHLRANGVKAINNLVDISNYVMLETGQPLHFYDLRTNPNREITIKDDLSGKYMALDGIEYEIEKGDLMITSNNEPIGIAGIMGGENTKILEDTTGLIIEAALFDHAQIRRTANRLGLQTEAAARFAKGLEPLSQNKAMDRAVQLLIELADAKDFEKTVEYGKVDYKPYEIEETVEHLNALIGKEYTVDEAVRVMERLQFKVRKEGNKFYTEIPSSRASDLKIREDIDEEIVRLTDFDSLVSTLPQMPQTVGALTPVQSARRIIRNLFTDNGMNETYSYTLVSQKHVDEACMPLGEAIALQSPLSEERKYVRNSLMNSMIESLAYNVAHGNQNVNLFEISTVYAKEKEGERVGIILSGNFSESKALHNKVEADFYVLKGLVYEMLESLGYHKERINLTENDLDTVHFHPYQSCVLKIGDKTIAILGKMHPNYISDIKIAGAYYAEIALNELMEIAPQKVKAPVINRYPSVSRDLSLLVDDETTAASIIKAIKKSGGKMVKSVEVFDIYKGEHIAEGKKSISFTIVYESLEATLTAEEVNKLHTKVVEELNRMFNANQR